MRLDTEEAKQFYRLMWGLLYYVNQKYPVIAGLRRPNLKGQPLDNVMELHDKLLSSPGLIDSFAAENPLGFSAEELDIVKSWKKAMEGDFLIVSHTKNYSVFLEMGEGGKAYGVLGLMSTIEEMVPPFLPLHCKTILLPFKGRIITCGIISPSPVHFGPSIRNRVREDFRKTKSRYGIITSLDSPPAENPQADEEMLRFYLGTEDRRVEYAEDIEQLLRKTPSLTTVYHQELGRANTRKLRKTLSRHRLAGWFAVLDDTIIASGTTKQDLQNHIHELVPAEKREWIYAFECKAQNEGEGGVDNYATGKNA